MEEQTTVTTAEDLPVDPVCSDCSENSVILREISDNFSIYTQEEQVRSSILTGKLDEIILKVDLVQESVAYQNTMLSGIFGISLVLIFGYIFFKRFL